MATANDKGVSLALDAPTRISLHRLTGRSRPESKARGQAAARARGPVRTPWLKALVDYVGAAVLTVVFGPLMLAIAALIRLESPGPVLFRQQRLGRGGRPFRVMKFRTMCVDAEARLKDLESQNESAGGVLFKMKRDPRVTRIGRVLRRTSLDELPQLFNVLAGDMSLVGPRPLQLRDCELLEQHDAEGFARRLDVLPGLTGLWQVSGRSGLNFEQMLALDLRYIERHSFKSDLVILLKTVKVVLLGRGAY